MDDDSCHVCALGRLLIDAMRRARPAGLGDAALFLAEEDALTLLAHAPPFGLRYRRVRLPTVRAFLRNATLPLRRHFGSCAVVGNSGLLRLREDGREIDAHDAVFRVGHAPPPHQRDGRKLRKYSGNRTTWRLVTTRWRDEAVRDPTARLIVVCDRPWVYDCQRDVLVNGSNPLVHLLNPRFYEAVRNVSGGSRIPLVGLVAAAVALRSCESVDVYGLSVIAARPDALALSPQRRVCGYYYLCRGRHVHEGIRTDRSYHLGRPGDAGYHDFAAHARTLLEWNRSGVLRLRGAQEVG